jgi:Lar family restriction alleviation protein
MVKLKHCPHCGSAAGDFQPTPIKRGVWAVFCSSCLARGPTGRNEQQARMLWNTRPINRATVPAGTGRDDDDDDGDDDDR